MHRDMYIIFDARSCSIYKKGKIIFFKNFLKNVFYQQAHSGLKNREKTYSEPEVILQLVHSFLQILAQCPFLQKNQVQFEFAIRSITKLSLLNSTKRGFFFISIQSGGLLSPRVFINQN